LTEEGIEHIEDIITLVFQYINLLKVIISLIIIQSYLNPYELFVN
jgi:secreted Zn-dependent insulinase-like peptidase